MNEISSALHFSLVIPLWNEGKNISQLVALIAESGLPEGGLLELILVNNGSSDDTGLQIDQAARRYTWIIPVHLTENANYGGGVYEGIRYARSEIVGYIPGDLQVLPEDVAKVWAVFRESKENRTTLFVKGHRTIRHDPLQTRLVSLVYTVLANLLLGLRVRDVNGLPKLFHRSLLDLVPAERMKTFVFDSQILSLARRHEWTIKEVPVTFHSRREGISSWSRKRFQVYRIVFRQILRLRNLRNAPGVPLARLR